MDLEKEDAIKSVEVSVSVLQQAYRFVAELCNSLGGYIDTGWPTLLCRTPSIFIFPPHVTNALPHSELQGHHEWPFAFRLPKGVSISEPAVVLMDMPPIYPLPASLSNRTIANGVYMEYHLIVRVRRGHLHRDSK